MMRRSLMITFFLVSLFYVDSIGQDTTRISFLFAGDVMGHDSQITAAYNKATGDYDYTRCFQFVKPYVQSVDLAIGNLEVTLAGPPYKGYPQFSSPDELAATLKETGFDVIVTANNHSVDRGKNGIHRTIDVLDSLGIPHTGTFTDEADRLNNYPLMINRNGFSIALLNYTYGTNGIPVPSPTIVNPLDTALISADIKSAKARNPDVIIAFVHWGVEYENLPRKNQQDLAAFFFRQGVGLVIGAHPHVLQPMEWRKDKNQVVVYSLGNFVSGQRKRYTDGGAMAYVELKKIRYKPDSIVTTIDSAGYFLQWVYRTVDVKKDYYILPATTFEKDTTTFIRDEASRTAFKTFVSDSRMLYDKHNINVPEIKTAPSDSLITYQVHLLTEMLDRDSVEVFITNLIDPFFGVQVNSIIGKENLTAIGPFHDYFRAKEICLQLAQKGWPAEVKKYVDGVIME